MKQVITKRNGEVVKTTTTKVGVKSVADSLEMLGIDYTKEANRISFKADGNEWEIEWQESKQQPKTEKTMAKGQGGVRGNVAGGNTGNNEGGRTIAFRVGTAWQSSEYETRAYDFSYSLKKAYDKAVLFEKGEVTEVQIDDVVRNLKKERYDLKQSLEDAVSRASSVAGKDNETFKRVEKQGRDEFEGLRERMWAITEKNRRKKIGDPQGV